MVSASTLDSGGGFVPADQQPTNAAAAAAASTQTKDSFTVQRSGLDVVANKAYAFSFAYVFEDPDNPSQYIQGTRSPNFIINLQTPDLTQPVTNLVVTPGLLSYGVKWDLIDKALPANKWLIDIQIYESLTGAFAGEEYLVWNGNGNSATILTSNTADRWIRVDTRDQDYRKKSVISAKFNTKDPIVVDTTGPGNVGSVTTVGSLDLDGIIGFNGHATISWAPVTGNGIRGYRIRWRQVATPETAYSYVDSPGTGTSYHLLGLGVGLTYEFAVATYDEYNNTSTEYISGNNITITGTPYIAGTVDVAGYFRAKANPADLDSTAFKFGYGIETGKRGLLFNANNYWYIDSNQSASLKVGGATSNYLLWNGTKLTIDGDINAKGGNFSGNIFMSTSGASIYNGTIDSSTGNLTGNGFALNSTGLKVANGTKSVTISAATGTITANGGSIGGWNISDTTLSKNNIILDSSGVIQVGSTAANSVYLQTAASGGTSFVMWAGNNTPDANAKFRVAADGTLYATGASVSGNITANSIAFGATYDGTSLSTIKSGAATGATALQPNGTLTGNVSGTVNGVAVATVTSGATKGSSAVQPGNGVTVDATTKAITAIKASSGLPISSGGTRPVYIDNTGLYMKNALGQDTIFLDSSSGSAVFRGTIYAAAGEFSGTLSAASGSFSGTITAGNSSKIGDWTVDSEGTLSTGSGLGGTYIFANNSSGNGLTFGVYTGKSIFATQGFSSTSGTPLTLVNTSPQISSGGGVRINNAFAPSSDDSFSLGFTTARWQIVRSAGGVSTTSDRRIKTNIETSDLGLNFIKLLKPVKYKFISGGKVPANGTGPIIVGDQVVDTEYIDVPGVRDHYGFIAQDVKEAIDLAGVEDFAGWQLEDKSNPDSQQALVHHHFIAPLTKAVQELSDMVESLQQEVNTLKGI
jgi:hypothetical protein